MNARAATFVILLASVLGAQLLGAQRTTRAAVARTTQTIRVYGGVKEKAVRSVAVPRTVLRRFLADVASHLSQRIVDAMRIEAGFALVADTAFGSISAGIADDSIPVIVYDPAVIDSLNQGAMNWEATSVLAHEIAHHLFAHGELTDARRQGIELEADEYSGAVMAIMGARLEDAQAVVRRYANDGASAYGPTTQQRLAAIARGFNARASSPLVARARALQPVATQAASAGAGDVFSAVDRYLAAWKTHQTPVLRALLSPDVEIVSTMHNPDGTRVSSRYTLADVMREASNTQQVFDERTIERTGKVDGVDATVLHRYNYYIDGRFSHCGEELYSLHRVSGAWRIASVVDHQTRQNCPAKP